MSISEQLKKYWNRYSRPALVSALLGSSVISLIALLAITNGDGFFDHLQKLSHSILISMSFFVLGTFFGFALSFPAIFVAFPFVTHLTKSLSVGKQRIAMATFGFLFSIFLFGVFVWLLGKILFNDIIIPLSDIPIRNLFLLLMPAAVIGLVGVVCSLVYIRELKLTFHKLEGKL